ncbi:MAG: phosphatidylglycerophosphatase A [Candidatus Omnitrophica bacterium]|nr:phosphatidylglycerophosphatase A [Candidatus Omnitrophota bacterium]
MKNILIKTVSTFFGIGYVPVAPGSAASVVAGVMCFLLFNNMYLYIFVFFVVTICGFLISGKMEDIVKEKDPSCVVIDEVSGMMITFFMLPRTWPVLITAFFLFRAFDMFKIYPVSYFEKKPGGIGIMMDDVAAGLYANIVMQISLFIFRSN